ncbi:hypothetical protein [Aeromonas salmonicida]|uniref:hypothetical protein n=1 Tax=Aeromonas salmonicida TaxID=645 RepID=UPI0031FC90B4
MKFICRKIANFLLSYYAMYLIIACISIFIVITYTIKIPFIGMDKEYTFWGNLGSYFGGVLSPIISFIALIYIVRAFLVQKLELKETKVALVENAKYNFEISKLQNTQTKIMHESRTLQYNSIKIDILHRKASYIQDDINNALRSKFISVKMDGGGLYHIAYDGTKKDHNQINDYVEIRIKQMNLLYSEINDTLKKMEQEFQNEDL